MTILEGSISVLAQAFQERAEASERPARWPVIAMILAVGSALLATSTLRHHAFRSGALDLGFFDQLTYLISRGHEAFSTILGWHLMGDHAAYVLYLIAPAYWVWPDVHVLLAVQAFALAAGAYPVWRLGRLAGLSQARALAVALAYLLYPIVLAANLFDFHPETISVPAMLFAALAARERRLGWFIVALAVAMGGKEIIALTVIAMGAWLALFEQRRLYGAVAIVLGAAWFVIAMKFVIPYFGEGKQASGVQYYSYLGHTFGQIVGNMIVEPQRWLPVLFSLRTVKYLCVLFLPVIWGLSPRHLSPLIAALPTLALNSLAVDDRVDMTSPFMQYSLMVVPFLALALVAGVAGGQTLLRRPRWIVAWSVGLVMLGAAARIIQVQARGVTDLRNNLASREAIEQIQDKGGVLTTHEITPHVSQRLLVQYIDPSRPLRPIDEFEYVLLNLSHGSAQTHDELTESILKQLHDHPEFRVAFQKDDVYLFRKVEPFLHSESREAAADFRPADGR